MFLPLRWRLRIQARPGGGDDVPFPIPPPPPHRLCLQPLRCRPRLTPIPSPWGAAASYHAFLPLVSLNKLSNATYYANLSPGALMPGPWGWHAQPQRHRASCFRLEAFPSRSAAKRRPSWDGGGRARAAAGHAVRWCWLGLAWWWSSSR